MAWRIVARHAPWPTTPPPPRHRRSTRSPPPSPSAQVTPGSPPAAPTPPGADPAPLPPAPLKQPAGTPFRYVVDEALLSRGLTLHASVEQNVGLLLPGDTLQLRLDNATGAAVHIRCVLRCEERLEHQFPPSAEVVAAAKAQDRANMVGRGVANVAMLGASIAVGALVGVSLPSVSFDAQGDPTEVFRETLKYCKELFEAAADAWVPARGSAELSLQLPPGLPPSFVLPSSQKQAGKCRSGIVYELFAGRFGQDLSAVACVTMNVGAPATVKPVTARLFREPFCLRPPAAWVAPAAASGHGQLKSCCSTAALEFGLAVPCGIMMIKSRRSAPWCVPPCAGRGHNSHGDGHWVCVGGRGRTYLGLQGCECGAAWAVCRCRPLPPPSAVLTARMSCGGAGAFI